MALKRFYPQWIGVYRDDNNAYYGGTTIRTSGAEGFNTYLGFNSSAILAEIASSKVKPVIHLGINVTNAGVMDLGAHKSTSNKASSGLPFYSWVGRSFIVSRGLATYDITNLGRSVEGQSTFEGLLKNAGYHGLVLYGAIQSGNYGEASSVYIEVEGVWNNPPTAGAVTYPTGSETLNGVITMKANAGSDPDGDSLTYQFALRDADGYHYFPRQAGLTRSVDLSKYKETSTAKVAVRAWDGQSYSEWKYSPVFTIRHNIAPSRPNLREPVGGQNQDRTESILFRWDHVDTDPQSAYTFRWRLRGGSTWNTIRGNSTNQYRSFPANTFPFGEIEWQVQTEDQGGLVSPWSSSGVFRSTEQSNAPTILSPANGEVISSEELTVTWSSVDQSAYEVELREGSNVVWGVFRTSGNKGLTVDYTLLNDSAYEVAVRTKIKDGLFSEWDTVTISTSFTQPPLPELSVGVDETISATIIYVNNPLPGLEQPGVAKNTIYRRNPQGEWLRVAENIARNGQFTDHQVASGVIYEYYAVAHGDNGTSADSVPVIASVKVNNILISLAEFPQLNVPLKYNGSESFQLNFEASRKRYAGRSKSVTIFGELSEWSISTSYLIEKPDYERLLSLISRRETLLFRDSSGRKHYVTPSSFSVVDDTLPDMFTISLGMEEADYVEGSYNEGFG